jgi:hypothetical protein
VSCVFVYVCAVIIVKCTQVHKAKERKKISVEFNGNIYRQKTMMHGSEGLSPTYGYVMVHVASTDTSIPLFQCKLQLMEPSISATRTRRNAQTCCLGYGKFVPLRGVSLLLLEKYPCMYEM